MHLKAASNRGLFSAWTGSRHAPKAHDVKVVFKWVGRIFCSISMKTWAGRFFGWLSSAAIFFISAITPRTASASPASSITPQPISQSQLAEMNAIFSVVTSVMVAVIERCITRQTR